MIRNSSEFAQKLQKKSSILREEESERESEQKSSNLYLSRRGVNNAGIVSLSHIFHSLFSAISLVHNFHFIARYQIQIYISIKALIQNDWYQQNVVMVNFTWTEMKCLKKEDKPNDSERNPHIITE